MNHVSMTTTEDLRTSQVAETKRRIARAVVEVIVRDGAVALSYPAVAEQAGVSLRTVYRHFPNKDELGRAASYAGSETFTAAFPPGERHMTNLRDFLPVLFADLERARDLVTVQHATRDGAVVRRERLRVRQEELVESLAKDYDDVSEADRERLASLMTVLMGSTVLFDLVDHLDVDVSEAAFLVAYAIESVAERARREGGVR
jgi:AcrR family transcriptional regulator